MKATSKTILCFFCGTGRADREYDHRTLGPRPCCASCDPANIASRGKDALERVTGTLVAQAQVGLLDLGDEREIHEHLKYQGFTDDEVGLFAERGIEAARRQMQRTATRLHPFGDRLAEAIAFVVMIVGLMGLYVVLNPPAGDHRLVHVAQVQR